MKPWKRIEPTSVQKVGWRTIVTKTFIMPNGQQSQWETIWPEGQQFVAIVPITPDNKIVICHMFRAGPEMRMDELPGGFVDLGEKPEEAAHRELLEETGYETGTMAYVGPVHKDTYMNAVWHVFLATDCALSRQQVVHHEVEEQIEVELISIDQLIYNAKHDKMTDVYAVLMTYDELTKRSGSELQTTN